MKKLVVGTTVLSAAMCGFAMVGPKDYVRDGLVALYDGVYNAKDASGAMTHDPAATSWANLVLGTGDIVLPDTAVIADGSVTLPSVTASAPDCSCARTSPITLEACVLSTTAATGNDKAFLTIPGRALVGYDGRNYGITVAAQASLPERCKLLTRTVEGKKELVLAVSAGLGLTLIVR